VADPAARFGLPEVKLGLIPGGGGTQRLPARIGTAAAKELLFLGSLIDAPRAHALGLVNQVSEPGGALATAQAIAARIAALPRVAVTGAKRAVNGAVPAAALDREREILRGFHRGLRRLPGEAQARLHPPLGGSCPARCCSGARVPPSAGSAPTGSIPRR
jgi:enoyl-CoA hydratase/carnithine racemase